MRLAEADPRFVAVNLVQPEDWDSSLRDYSLQMRMVGYLRTQYPKAHVTLHAGELWPGLVKPEDLEFHIREAVDVARTERVGHGVDLVHEDHWQRTARTMANREVAVEVPFSSNAQILGVKGPTTPSAPTAVTAFRSSSPRTTPGSPGSTSATSTSTRPPPTACATRS